MGAATVILGLAPSILQALSPSPSSTALLALRRPFLSLLLGFASPSTAGAPAVSDYASSVAALSEPLPVHSRGCFPYTTPRTLGYYGGMAAVVSVVQYVLALLAVGSSVWRTYQLCIWTVCTFAPTVAYLPALWHGAVGVLHLLGWLAMRLSIRKPEGNRHGSQEKGLWEKMRNAFVEEVTPAAFHEAVPVEGRVRGPAPFFSLATTCLYVGVPIHVGLPHPPLSKSQRRVSVLIYTGPVRHHGHV